MTAYSVYNAYLGELRASVDFCRISAQIRPRLNDYVRWEAADDAVKAMFQRFLRSQPKELLVYQSAVVSLHSGFEQFAIDLVEDAAEVMTKRKLDVDTFEKKFPGVVKHSCVASGHALVSMFEPRNYWKLDYNELIGRLATSRVGSSAVAIYGRSYGVRKVNLSCDELEKLMIRIGFTLPWADICRDNSLQRILGADGKAAAEVALKSRLAKVLELRNNLAHSQGADVVEYEQVINFIDIYERFSALLDSALLKFAAA